MKNPLQKITVTRFGGICLAFLIVAVSLKSGFAQSTSGLSNQVIQQMSAISAMKTGFNAAEKKMSSNLVFRSRVAAGKSIGAATSLVNSSKATSSTVVKVTLAGRVTPDLLQFIKGSGGSVTASSGKYGRVDAKMPLSAIPLVAGRAEVNWIREDFGARTNGGALTSQGYISHGANTVSPVNGNGVKVGVLSDSASATTVSSLQATGDLGPNTTVLSGQGNDGGGEDEGTAMMEIVQDLAPKAQLYFATAFTGEVQFAQNIADLASAGCSIIVDDVTYFDEGVFQDGPVAQEVTSFVNGGGLYFSSAANSGNLTSGTSGTWEGDFNSGGNAPAVLGEPGKVHDFGGQNWDVLTVPAAPAGFDQFIILKWSDPLGGSSNDYDLFVTNSTGTTLKGASADSQTGTQDPIELIDYTTQAAGDRIYVVKFSGVKRALHLDTERGQLSINTDGATFGHNAGTSTIGCAAVYWDSNRAGTVPFSAADRIESFSSDGPRRLFYLPNGSPITAGNFLFGTNGGTTIVQPLVSAADGVDEKTSAFTPFPFPFFGTSAAAPHAAGIAALVKSANPSLANFQIKQLLLNNTIDIMAAGIDRDSGYGILQAKPAVNGALGQSLGQ